MAVLCAQASFLRFLPNCTNSGLTVDRWNDPKKGGPKTISNVNFTTCLPKPHSLASLPLFSKCSGLVQKLGKALPHCSQAAELPERALHFPTFSHLIVNKSLAHQTTCRKERRESSSSSSSSAAPIQDCQNVLGGPVPLP